MKSGGGHQTVMGKAKKLMKKKKASKVKARVTSEAPSAISAEQKRKVKNIDDEVLADVSEEGKVPLVINHEQHFRSDKNGHYYAGNPFEKEHIKARMEENTLKTSFKLLEWIIAPLSVEEFFNDYWEKRPLLIKRNRLHFKHLAKKNEQGEEKTQNEEKEVEKEEEVKIFSSQFFDTILKERDIRYTINVDVTKYTNGVRTTHNPPGKATAASVWDFFRDGCSLRFLNPATYNEVLWQMEESLQQFFGFGMGCNIYLTPAGTQGFAPHYDDIEAFLLQLEGSKRWRVYMPRNEDENLARTSSGNFKPEEVVDKPVIDEIVREGDLLYFPKGFVHQGEARKEHSMHATISTAQKTSWADFLEIALPRALSIAARENVEYRKSLPVGYYRYMGLSKAVEENEQRREFVTQFCSLMENLTSYMPLDGVVDEFVVKYMKDCYPPCLTKKEKEVTVFKSNPAAQSAKSFAKVKKHPISLNSKVRMVRPQVARMTIEEDVAVLHHLLDNTRIYHEREEETLDFAIDVAPALATLIDSYPSYVTVGDLPITPPEEGEADEEEDNELKLTVVKALYDRGLLMLPLQ
eukprot:Nk52_evm86s1737 gene=Nk52_evmTU86s1737